jgi:Spy/CpxP family protein refolding chaperone
MNAMSLVAGVAAALLLTVPAAAQPLGVGEILDRRQELGLSSAQVERLEQLNLEAIRDAIRRQADLMIAQVDLAALLDVDPSQAVDLARAEAKLREIERARTDSQLALVRVVETAKSELTPEQRTKLAASDALPPALDPPPTESDVPGKPNPRGLSAPVILARGTGPAHPGGAIGRPPGPTGPHVSPPHPRPGVPHAPPRRFEHRFDRGPHVRFFPDPFWWDPFWVFPPVIVPGPPVSNAPPPPTYWYYCPSLGEYYPHVRSCPEPWVPIPAS